MSDESLLPGIISPADLRAIPREELGRVTEELRDEIVHRVSQTGGHLASSLGAVVPREEHSAPGGLDSAGIACAMRELLDTEEQ